MNVYGNAFFSHEGKCALSSAEIILPYVIQKLSSNSIVDFGCGTGEWLRVAKGCGVDDILGLDGKYTEDHLVIDKENFKAVNFTEKIELGRKYDLAISLEVAEHLPESAAKTYIDSIVRHADVVLFSAAIPGQGGTMHVNEQYPTYWEKIFAENGYCMCDCIRNEFWEDTNVEWFYRQNVMIYCKEELVKEIEEKFESKKRIKDVVHPEVFKLSEDRRRIFPFDKVSFGSRVIVYGASNVGKEFMNQLLTTQYATPVLWCDGSYEQYNKMGIPINNPEEVKNVEFDFVVIAIESERTANSISDRLLELGVPKEKIIWKYPRINKVY